MQKMNNHKEIVQAIEEINAQLWHVALSEESDVFTKQLFQDFTTIFIQLARYYSNKKLDRIEIEDKLYEIKKRMLLYADLHHNKAL